MDQGILPYCISGCNDPHKNAHVGGSCYTEWVRLTHVGFSLLGEQGAESIHAKFNSLGRAYTAIPDMIERLKCIMKEHLVSIAPDMVAAIPPPKKRKKSLDDT